MNILSSGIRYLTNFKRAYMLSKEMTTELQVIFREEFGIVITPENAENVGDALLKYVQLLSKMSDEINLNKGGVNENKWT